MQGPYFGSSSKCGLRRVKTFEEASSYPGKWPWAATIYAKDKNFENQRFCGATLINSWTLVTGEKFP